MFGLALLVACSGGDDLTVTATFSNTRDIEEGSAVFFDGKEIGEVSEVGLTDSGSIVELNLDASASKKLSNRSALVVNRLKKGAPLELYSQKVNKENAIQQDQEIEGLDSMFQLGAWMIGDAIQTGTGSLSKYVGAFQEYLGSEEFEDSKAQVAEQINHATISAKEAVVMVEKEVTGAISELSINEEEMAKVIEQLGDELSPVVKEAARNSTELVAQLEKFIVNIEENADINEQQTGEQFLQSLVDTFEKLNQSIEEGVEQGQENK